MPTETIYKGTAFEIRSWVDSGSNIVLGFLEELQADGDTDAERLFNLIKRTADIGVTKNVRHVRSLGNDIYEFKAPNTGRIMFFYDKNRLIICAHGFTGKKGHEGKFIQRQIKKAIDIKEEYFAEKGE
jgi:hypothetical protein